jgi:transcriptional regulator with XRE-family HTH domain
MNIAKHFGPRLKEIRLARGLRQLDLAERTGLTANTIGRFERNELDPVWSKVVMLAEALGVGVEEFTRKPQKTERQRIRKKQRGKR